LEVDLPWALYSWSILKKLQTDFCFSRKKKEKKKGRKQTRGRKEKKEVEKL